MRAPIKEQKWRRGLSPAACSSIPPGTSPGATRGWIVLTAVLACASCVTKTGTPIAFAPSTFHEDAPPIGTFKRGERVRGESCEKALVFIEMNGAPLGIRLDDSAVPRDTDIALADAESKCKGCAFLANVTVDTEHRSQCLGFIVEECTIVKGTAMHALPTTAPAPASAPAYPE